MGQTNNRIYWIDLCKLILIIIVAICHVPPNDLTDWTYYLANTPFFFLSGYCLKKATDTSLWEYTYKKAKTLLVPILCFFTFFYVFWLAIGKTLAHDDDIAWYQPIEELLTGQLKTVIAPMWFIITLFVMQVLYFSLSKHMKTETLFIVTLIISIISQIIPVTHFWQLHNALFYMPIYVLGVYIKEKESETKQVPYWMLLIMSLAGIGIMSWFEYDSIPYLIALSPILLIYTFTWVRTMFFITISIDQHCKHYQWMSLMGQNTIILLPFHIYVIGVTKVMLNHIFNTGDFLGEHFICKFPIGLFSILVLYPLVKFIVRYLPWVLGKKPVKQPQ